MVDFSGGAVFFIVVGGILLTIILAVRGYWKHQEKMVESRSGKSGEKEAFLQGRLSALEGKKQIATRGEESLEEAEERYEEFVIKEEFNKLQLSKLLAERAKIIQRVGFNALDPKWTQTSIMSTTLGVLNNLGSLTADEIGKANQILGFDKKKEQLDEMQEKIDKYDVKVDEEVKKIEGLEYKAEAIEMHTVGKDLKRIVASAKSYERKIRSLVQKNESLMKKDFASERKKIKIEKNEDKLITDFEKLQEQAIQEIRRVKSIISDPGKRNTAQVTSEIKKIMSIYQKDANVLKKAEQLNEKELRIMDQLLAEREQVLNNQIKIQELLVKRDGAMEVIAMKERKAELTKEWAIAKGKDAQVGAEAKRYRQMVVQQRAQERKEAAEAHKEAEESGQIAAGFDMLSRAL